MKIKFYKDESIILAALAAKVSQTAFDKSIDELYEECKNNKNAVENLVKKIMEKYGHLIFGDFVGHAIAFEGISRLAAIYLWRNINTLNLVFGAGIEASLRVVKPEKFIFKDELFEKAKELYDKAVNKGIKEQDARYVLPEATLTRIILSFPPRYYAKLVNAFKKVKLDEFQKIADGLEKIVREEFKLNTFEELPTEWKFYGEWQEQEEKIDIQIDGNDVNSISLNAYILGSLAMWAQLVRQRQNLCIIEPLSNIVRNADFVLPNSFDGEIVEAYMQLAKEFNEKQKELMAKKRNEFVYYLLLGQKARGRVYGKGEGVIETAKHRSCGVAQWEIRSVVGLPLFYELSKYDFLLKKVGPPCYRNGRCTEPLTFKTKKGFCRIFNDYIRKINFENMDADYIRGHLKEDYKSFKIQY